MITLPDFKKAFDYENDFYLSCDINRMSKVLAQYELYKKIVDISGEIVECGVFKGASFSRFAMLRGLFNNIHAKKLIGFDIFGEFPETEFTDDKEMRRKFIEEAGSQSISKEQLEQVLIHKGLYKNVDLVSGDIVKTVPEYVKLHPELKISLLNLDTDIYEPAVTILENLYPRVVYGGVIIFDDYGTFPGETKAVDEFFSERKVVIRKFPFAMSPSYIIKE